MKKAKTSSQTIFYTLHTRIQLFYTCNTRTRARNSKPARAARGGGGGGGRPLWNTKRDKNRNHELCERGSDRATLGLENRWVGARESLCWDDRTALVLEYHCQGCDDRTTQRFSSPNVARSLPLSHSSWFRFLSRFVFHRPRHIRRALF